MKIPAGQDNIIFDIPIYGQHLWTLDDPFLYEVELSLSREGEEYDRVNTYFGMRKIATGRLPGSNDRYITLNNKPIYLQMALDQGFHPEGYYTYPSDEFMKEDVLRAKDIGLNGLRIHLKAGIPRQLYWADKLGLLIQADIPNLNTASNQGGVSEYGKKTGNILFRNRLNGITTIRVFFRGCYLMKHGGFQVTTGR
jgi:beta-galactosidase/beta-glucuronidase